MSETPVWLLFVSATISVSLVWVYIRARQWGFAQSQALDLAMLLTVSMALGGRLMHVIYEQPEYYIAHPFRVLFIWEGGFVYYGGLLTALAASWWWCQRRDQNFWRWADFFAPVFAFTYASGRMGCFINGCCYGRICDLPWGVRHAVHELWGLEVVTRHPTQLYAAGFETVTMVLLLWLERRKLPLGHLFSLWLGLHAAGRLVMEYFRDDFRGPSPFGFSPAVWLSLFLLATSLHRLVLKRPSLSN